MLEVDLKRPIQLNPRTTLVSPQGLKQPPQNPPGFGNRMSIATGLFSKLERNPIAEILFIDILGLNVPRIAVARTWRERLDTAVSELTNTSATIFGTFAIAPVTHWLANKISGVPLSAINKELSAVTAKITPRVQLARLAGTFAFLFPFASMPWSNPFLRNWLTLRRNGIASFDTLIGLDKNQSAKKHTLQEQLDYQMKRYIGVNAIGVGLALASAVGLGLWARKTTVKDLSPIMKWVSNTFSMHGAKADQIKGLAAFGFWSAPAYLGWLQASRGHNEYWEWMLKFANSTMWFFIFGPKIVNPAFAGSFNKIVQKATQINPGFTNSPTYKDLAKRFSGKLYDQLIHMKNIQYGSAIIISTVMMGLTPQLLNIYFTKRRYEKSLIEKALALQPQSQNLVKPEAAPGAVVQKPLEAPRFHEVQTAVSRLQAPVPQWPGAGYPGSGQLPMPLMPGRPASMLFQMPQQSADNPTWQ